MGLFGPKSAKALKNEASRLGIQIGDAYARKSAQELSDFISKITTNDRLCGTFQSFFAAAAADIGEEESRTIVAAAVKSGAEHEFQMKTWMAGKEVGRGDAHRVATMAADIAVRMLSYQH